MPTTTPEVWTIVVAAGSGRRFGASKQFAVLGAETVVERSCRIASEVSSGVVVVLPAAEPVGAAAPASGSEALAAEVVATPGGPTRADSVRCGLRRVPGTADVVLVHDAARPLASAGLYRRVIDAVVAGAPVVVPGADVVDTLRRRDGGPAVAREELVRVQTPQGFRGDVLRAAHESGGDATDDATLAERAGHEVTIVEGEDTNIKITTPHDLVIAAALLADEGPP